MRRDSRSLLLAFLLPALLVVLFGYAITWDVEDIRTTVLDGGQALVTIVVPPDFARDLDDGRSAQLQVLVDGSDANTAAIALGCAQGTVRSVSTRTLPQGAELPRLITVETRVWYNEELQSKNMIVPGLVATVLTLVTLRFRR